MGTLARILLLTLLFAVTLSCSLDTETGKEASVRGAAPAVAAPVEVPLDVSVPEAIELLQDLLGKASDKPDSGVRRGELGMAYEVNGFVDAAFTSYQQAELLDHSEARWPYYQALILAGRGQQQQALQTLGRAIDIDATYAPAWMWYGTWSLDVGLVNQADEAFIRAESLGLGGPATAGQARVHLRQHRPDEAIALLEPLSRDFQYPSVFQPLGRAYREVGRLDDARIALARGKSAQPGWQDDWQEQKRIYEVGIQARFVHAERLLGGGRTSEALKTLKSLIEEQPDNGAIILLLSYAYDAAGERERAFRVLLKALDRPPVHHGIHINLAGYYERRGDPETALEHLDRAIELNPAAALPYTNKGLLLQKQRKHEDALAAFESALRNDASNAQVFYYAGQIEATLKRWPKATRRFEESIRVDPTFTMGHLNLARSLAYENRFEDARIALNRAEKLGTQKRQVQAAIGYLADLEKRSK